MRRWWILVLLAGAGCSDSRSRAERPAEMPGEVADAAAREIVRDAANAADSGHARNDAALPADAGSPGTDAASERTPDPDAGSRADSALRPCDIHVPICDWVARSSPACPRTPPAAGTPCSNPPNSGDVACYYCDAPDGERRLDAETDFESFTCRAGAWRVDLQRCYLE